MIIDISSKEKANKGLGVLEEDYSFITSAILPYYFHHTQNTN